MISLFSNLSPTIIPMHNWHSALAGNNVPQDKSNSTERGIRMTGTLFGETSVQEFKDLRQASLARFVWIDSMNNFHTEMTRQVATTSLPSHASDVTISKPSDHVARYGLARLTTCCSHRRSSKVLLLFDLGMQPGAVPCGKLLEYLLVLTPYQFRISRCNYKHFD
ncbi:hypothetical protein M436DRAFT_60499 [Aureobasidium namibiae CBS 147.97]|uniref:Uncharacterized protein n=1 Tax=Aureobasidium namibiae CBS 147.97 TaxID=1043004 RepID=A0A074XQ17_9PEZI|nr:uncharacterized protein M436DRAFT_60499 [Aureobasidium namibiae CBS 147.97]KEQ76676.1 hypothetical protein M436DRAFT_60499 [Aureobasidium namibiae CBS 147.97]